MLLEGQKTEADEMERKKTSNEGGLVQRWRDLIENRKLSHSDNQSTEHQGQKRVGTFNIVSRRYRCQETLKTRPQTHVTKSGQS